MAEACWRCWRCKGTGKYAIYVEAKRANETLPCKCGEGPDKFSILWGKELFTRQKGGLMEKMKKPGMIAG